MDAVTEKVVHGKYSNLLLKRNSMILFSRTFRHYGPLRSAPFSPRFLCALFYPVVDVSRNKFIMFRVKPFYHEWYKLKVNLMQILKLVSHDAKNS